MLEIQIKELDLFQFFISLRIVKCFGGILISARIFLQVWLLRIKEGLSEKYQGSTAPED